MVAAHSQRSGCRLLLESPLLIELPYPLPLPSIAWLCHGTPEAWHGLSREPDQAATPALVEVGVLSVEQDPETDSENQGALGRKPMIFWGLHKSCDIYDVHEMLRDMLYTANPTPAGLNNFKL